jgi:hypothetical protein
MAIKVKAADVYCTVEQENFAVQCRRTGTKSNLHYSNYSFVFIFD